MAETRTTHRLRRLLALRNKRIRQLQDALDLANIKLHALDGTLCKHLKSPSR